MRAPLTPLTLPPQGPRGASGVQTGFGQITYTERTIQADDVFAPNVRQQIRFNPPTITTQDYLRTPFAGLPMFANDRLIGRAMGDLTIGLVNLLVTSMQAGGMVKMDIDVGSSLGPTGSATAILFEGANVPERVSLPFKVQTLANLLANGAAFFLTSKVPLTVTSESVLICPISLGPSA